ncbi:MAG: GGDEF domain-containing protein [Gammaproteobacteria bacterium]
MPQKTANQVVTHNGTFEAARSTNLHHYDIIIALQTTLDFGELINIFSNKIQSLVPHSGYTYRNDEFGMAFQNGIETRNALNYQLNVENRPLGELKFMRRKKFSVSEIELLETLLCTLIYPLRNASLLQLAVNRAQTDPLTHTRNRRAFHEAVQEEINLAHRNDKPLGLIFLDIDHFKTINDRYGHDCGDYALTEIAKRIKESVRSNDPIYRYGGEEFVIILREVGTDGMLALAERIRKNVERHVLSYGVETLSVTVSVGLSLLRCGDRIDDLIGRADRAMYRAKKSGRNRVAIE